MKHFWCQLVGLSPTAVCRGCPFSALRPCLVPKQMQQHARCCLAVFATPKITTPPPFCFSHPRARAPARSVGELRRKGQRRAQGGYHRRHRRGSLQGHGGAVSSRGDQAFVNHHPRARTPVHFHRDGGCVARVARNGLVTDLLWGDIIMVTFAIRARYSVRPLVSKTTDIPGWVLCLFLVGG